MNFDTWEMINESILFYNMKKNGDEIRSVMNDSDNGLTDKIYVIPNFDRFRRSGEPVQQSILCTDKKMRTFSFNYNSHDGKLYSVDFWKINSRKPTMTIYFKRYESMNDVYDLVASVVKEPSKEMVNLKKFMNESMVFEQKDSETKMTLSEPKDSESIDPDVEKAQNNSKGYDYSNYETIFDDLKVYVKMVIEGKQPSLIVTGQPGIGKTYVVTQEMEKSGLKKGDDYMHIKGRSTAAGMFISLYENRNKIIIFDDCDSIFKSQDAVNILKGALDSYDERQISWLVGRALRSADGTDIPKTFVFTGKIIFISNLPQSKIDDAVKSRSFVLEIALSPGDMIKKMKAELPCVMKKATWFSKEMAMDLIEQIYDTDNNLELNMRTLIKAIKITSEIDNFEIAERLIRQQCSYK